MAALAATAVWLAKLRQQRALAAILNTVELSAKAGKESGKGCHPPLPPDLVQESFGIMVTGAPPLGPSRTFFCPTFHDLGCAFRFVFQFLTGLIFRNLQNSV